MLFSFRYRSHFHLSEEQFERESDDAKWAAKTIWSLIDKNDTLKKGSGVNDQYN